MVKLMACLRRKAGMSAVAFHHYWKETHGPLVKSVTEFSRYIRRYTQSHTMEDPASFFPPHSTPAYDGIAELWFESTEEMQKAFSEPRYLEIIRPDEQKFIDLSHSVFFIVDEVPMIEG